MKKVITFQLILLFLLPGCLKDSDPEPLPILSHFYIYNFLREPYNVQWDINESVAHTQHSYGVSILGAVILQDTVEEVTFTVKESGSDRVIHKEMAILQGSFTARSPPGTGT